jgi:hypothetical protein
MELAEEVGSLKKRVEILEKRESIFKSCLYWIAHFEKECPDIVREVRRALKLASLIE